MGGVARLVVTETPTDIVVHGPSPHDGVTVVTKRKREEIALESLREMLSASLAREKTGNKSRHRVQHLSTADRYSYRVAGGHFVIIAHHLLVGIVTAWLVIGNFGFWSYFVSKGVFSFNFILVRRSLQGMKFFIASFLFPRIQA